MKKKTIALLLALVLAVGAAAGGTFAYLTDKTEEVKNTFTIGNINIDLTETTTDYKMVPGTEIAKDPTVTVKAGSEACWLFVKVEKSDNFDTFVTYTAADGWTQGDGTNVPANVYYREVAAASTDTGFAVLKGNKVSVKTDVTKAMLDALTEATYPTLTFTGYAVQKVGFNTVAAAWTEANK